MSAAMWGVEIPKEAYGMMGAALGALIALTGTIGTLLVAPRFQRKMEEGKLRAARQDTLHKELLSRIQALTVDFASAAHSMCWLVWKAEHDALDADAVTEYDKEMHTVLPKISGGVVVVAALDQELSSAVTKVARNIFALDAEIGGACIKFKSDPAIAKTMLIDLAAKVRNFEEHLRTAICEPVRERTLRLLAAKAFGEDTKPAT